MITNILLAFVVAWIVGFSAVVWWLSRRFMRTLKLFIEPESEGQPSPLAKVTDATASMFARAVIAQGKGLLMGLQSGAVRAEKAITADIQEGIAQQNPLGAMLTSFPALRKSLRRNPALMDVALQLFRRGGSQVREMNNNGGNGEQPRFKF